MVPACVEMHAGIPSNPNSRFTLAYIYRRGLGETVCDLQPMAFNIVNRLTLNEHQATMTDLTCCDFYAGAPSALPSTSVALGASEAAVKRRGVQQHGLHSAIYWESLMDILCN